MNNIKKKIYIVIGVIIVIVVFLSISFRNVIELGFNTYLTYENDLKNFKENIKSFDSMIDIVLKDLKNEPGAYKFGTLDNYTEKQQVEIKKVFNYYEKYYHEKPDFWEYKDNMIYYQDGRAAYRLVYSVDKNTPKFESDDFGFWKGTRINRHWYFFAYVYK